MCVKERERTGGIESPVNLMGHIRASKRKRKWKPKRHINYKRFIWSYHQCLRRSLKHSSLSAWQKYIAALYCVPNTPVYSTVLHIILC